MADLKIELQIGGITYEGIRLPVLPRVGERIELADENGSPITGVVAAVTWSFRQSGNYASFEKLHVRCQ